MSEKKAMFYDVCLFLNTPAMASLKLPRSLNVELGRNGHIQQFQATRNSSNQL